MRSSAAKSWSDSARAAFDAYPWPDEAEKRRAWLEAELLAPGDEVGLMDLPGRVRRAARAAANPIPAADVVKRLAWKGEALADLVSALERTVISQALDANCGQVAAAARALGSTPRIVAYKARKLGIAAGAKSNER